MKHFIQVFTNFLFIIFLCIVSTVCRMLISCHHLFGDTHQMLFFLNLVGQMVHIIFHLGSNEHSPSYKQLIQSLFLDFFASLTTNRFQAFDIFKEVD